MAVPFDLIVRKRETRRIFRVKSLKGAGSHLQNLQEPFPRLEVNKVVLVVSQHRHETGRIFTCRENDLRPSSFLSPGMTEQSPIAFPCSVLLARLIKY